MTTLLNACRVTPPPPHSVEEKLVPLSHMDIFWLRFHPIRGLLFYTHPNCSKAHFFESIVPQLKESLSITLKDYLPVAGNLLYPLIPEKKPIFRCRVGDSVSLTFAESSYDFDELTGNHAKDADQFYDFVPQMPPFVDEPDYKIAPVLALQVTLFPDRGICIGIAHYHCLGDVSSILSFIRAWAANNKFSEDDDEFLLKERPPLPIFDRSLIVDPLGIDTLYWNFQSRIPIEPSSFPLPTNRVRATYTLHPTDIKQLKELVLARKPGVAHVSSFVVTVSYIWTCLVKSRDAAGEEVKGVERLIFPVDARPRMNPPVPANYFGNCLGYGRVRMEHKELVREEAFLIAAEAVAEHIKNTVNNKDELFKGAENWLSQGEECMRMMRNVGVAGSPKFDMTSADFGWGTAKRLEVVSLDEEKYSASLCKSRESEGGLEVGLSLPKETMEAFAAIFAEGLRSLV